MQHCADKIVADCDMNAINIQILSSSPNPDCIAFQRPNDVIMATIWEDYTKRQVERQQNPVKARAYYRHMLPETHLKWRLVCPSQYVRPKVNHWSAEQMWVDCFHLHLAISLSLLPLYLTYAC